MAQFLLFKGLEEADKEKAIEKLIKSSVPRQDFFLMIVLSVLMATLGILINSEAVVIGSMLITPLLYPVLSLSLGVVMASYRLINQSLKTLLKSIVLGITAAVLASLLFSYSLETNPVLIYKLEPSFLYLAIALIAGLAMAFALVKPHLNETLPGVAVSVTLIPPLATIGIALSKLNWHAITSALIVFLINIVGIIFATVIVFSLMRFYPKRKKAQQVIKKEQAEIEKIKEENSELEV
jgi:uncharacterized hydrophobic protein (TIGR00271 family)